MASKAGLAQQDCRRQKDQEHDEDGNRDVEDLAGGQVSKGFRETGNRPPLSHQQSGAPRDAHHSQGRNEWRESPPGYQDSIEQAAEESADQAGCQGQRERNAGLQQSGHHHTRQGQDRTHREVDSGGDDHKGHPGRHDGDHRGLLHDVEKVRKGQEVGSQNPQNHTQAQQAQQRSQLAPWNGNESTKSHGSDFQNKRSGVLSSRRSRRPRLGKTARPCRISAPERNQIKLPFGHARGSSKKVPDKSGPRLSARIIRE